MSHKPFRILVVDDERTIVDFVRSLLGDAGIEIEVAATGAEAIARSAARLADLILLDVVLPGLDGIATLRLLRSRPEFSRVPIYMMTARVRPEDREESRRAGADGHIEKPFKGAELAELVSQLRHVRAVD